MNRRQFLAQLGIGLLSSGSLLFENPLRPRFRVARAASGKVLVIIFQKGGCDGLNTIVPYGDADYYIHRPTIAIGAPDPANPAAAINIDGFFGFHPALAAFQSIYGNGDMAIMPAVHYPNAPRSHFDSQLWMESAATGPVSNPDGWLSRHLASQPVGGNLRAVGFSHGEDSGLPDSLRGAARASCFGDITDFGLKIPRSEETSFFDRLRPLYEEASAEKSHEASLKKSGRIMMDDLNLLRSINFAGYTPANGAVYPGTTLGTSLKQTAQLVKEGVGLEVAALTRHGWDTHENQGTADNPGSRHYSALTDFGQSIAAFYQDLGSLMSDVLIVTMTEFGRTARENGGGGTDHGFASAWFAIGNSVNGGIHLGSGWPGLAPDNLHENRDLAYTIDYRDIMGEVLLHHLGNTDLPGVLPGHSYTPVGFLGA